MPKYVLIIDEYIPMPDKDAGSKSTQYFINYYLTKGYRVIFIADKQKPLEANYIELLKERGIIVYHDNSRINEIINQNSIGIEIIFINRINILKKNYKNLKLFKGRKIIFFGHDLRSLRKKRQFLIEKNFLDLFRYFYWRYYENKLHKKVDLILYPSNVEVDFVKKENRKLNVHQIDLYPCVQIKDVISEESFNDRKGVLFVGSFDHKPNLDGILWFLKSVYTQIRKEVHLYIVGSNTPPQLYNFKSDRIVIKGYISDEELNNLYQKCKLVIIPLRFGAGIKGKMLEALFRNIPVVSTSIGAEGIKDINQIVMIKNSSKEFAECIDSIYFNNKLLNDYSKKIREFVYKNFLSEQLDNYYKQLLL